MGSREEIKVTKEFVEAMDEHRVPLKELGFIGACSENVVVFAERMLGLRLYSWQVQFLNKIQEALADKETGQREFLAMTSRQIGKSTAVAVVSLWAAVFNKYPGTISNNTTVLITSASDIQAKKLLSEMKKLLRIGDRYILDTYRNEDGEPLFSEGFFEDLIDEHGANNTITMSFKAHKPETHGDYLLAGSKSGSIIKSYPPTSSVLGETASVVIIDEAGKTDKITDQFFHDFIRPVGTSTDAVYIYTSTPWVSSGFFYRMIDPDEMYGESPADISIFTIDAIREEGEKQFNSVQKNFIEPLKRDGKLDEINRAYYCRFVKGEQSYFNPEKVVKVFTKEYDRTDAYTQPCDMGVDFGGQVSSKTVITISELTTDGIVRRLYHKTYPVGEDGNLLEDIEVLLTQFNIQRIIPDECPQGDYMIREMKEKGWNVQPMNFRSEKVKKYGAFRSWMNKGKILSYFDEDIQTEMLALEFAHGRRQSVISAAPGYNDDLIDSFVMSTYFYVTEEGGIRFFDWDKEDE